MRSVFVVHDRQMKKDKMSHNLSIPVQRGTVTIIKFSHTADKTVSIITIEQETERMKMQAKTFQTIIETLKDRETHLEQMTGEIQILTWSELILSLPTTDLVVECMTTDWIL